MTTVLQLAYYLIVALLAWAAGVMHERYVDRDWWRFAGPLYLALVAVIALDLLDP